jgi:hypothetical protein
LTSACAGVTDPAFFHTRSIQINADTCRKCDPFSISVSESGAYEYLPLKPTPYRGNSPRIAQAFADLASSANSAPAVFSDRRFPDGLLVVAGNAANAPIMKLEQGKSYSSGLLRAIEAMIAATSDAVNAKRSADAATLSANQLARVSLNTSFLNNACGVLDASVEADGRVTVHAFNPRGGPSRTISEKVPFDEVEGLVRRYRLAGLWDEYPVHWKDVPSLRIRLAFGPRLKTIDVPDVTMAPAGAIGFANALTQLVIDGPKAVELRTYCAPFRKLYKSNESSPSPLRIKS